MVPACGVLPRRAHTEEQRWGQARNTTHRTWVQVILAWSSRHGHKVTPASGGLKLVPGVAGCGHVLAGGPLTLCHACYCFSETVNPNPGYGLFVSLRERLRSPGFFASSKGHQLLRAQRGSAERKRNKNQIVSEEQLCDKDKC